MTAELRFNELDDFPQRATLERVARDLWSDPTVLAVWLAGSLATGAGDAGSDIDLRAAIMPAGFPGTKLPAALAWLVEHRAAGITMPFGPAATLHHTLLDTGEIVDLLLIGADGTADPMPETRIVLGARDHALAVKLAEGEDPPPARFPPAEPEAACALIEEFWLHFSKHRKVLDRGLDVLLWEGDFRARRMLLRLLFIDRTGTDCGQIERMTIHSMMPMARRLGAQALASLGAPARTREELIQAIEIVAGEVTSVGHDLAARLGFPYPIKAEAVARRLWDAPAPE